MSCTLARTAKWAVGLGLAALATRRALAIMSQMSLMPPPPPEEKMEAEAGGTKNDAAEEGEAEEPASSPPPAGSQLDAELLRRLRARHPELVDMLLSCGQEHLFEGWGARTLDSDVDGFFSKVCVGVCVCGWGGLARAG